MVTLIIAALFGVTLGSLLGAFITVNRDRDLARQALTAAGVTALLMLVIAVLDATIPR